MARFQGLLFGNRGGAKRLGTAESGITVKANGWDRGIEVHAYVDKETGLDTFEVWRTGGTAAGIVPQLIGRYI